MQWKFNTSVANVKFWRARKHLYFYVPSATDLGKEFWFLWEMSKPLYLSSPSYPSASDPMAKESTTHPSPFGPLVITLVTFSWPWSSGILQVFPPFPSSWGQGASEWHGDPVTSAPPFSSHKRTPSVFSWAGEGNFWETSKMSRTQVMGLSTYRQLFFTSEMRASAALLLGRPTDPRTQPQPPLTWDSYLLCPHSPLLAICTTQSPIGLFSNFFFFFK